MRGDFIIFDKHGGVYLWFCLLNMFKETTNEAEDASYFVFM
jgi:hypothetical protein